MCSKRCITDLISAGTTFNWYANFAVILILHAGKIHPAYNNITAKWVEVLSVPCFPALTHVRSVPCLRRLGSGLWRRSPLFDSKQCSLSWTIGNWTGLSSSLLFSSGTNIPTVFHTRISLIYHQRFHNPSNWEPRCIKYFAHPRMHRDLNNQSIMYIGKRNLTSSTWVSCRNVGKVRSSLGCAFWIAKLVPSCLVRGNEMGHVLEFSHIIHVSNVCTAHMTEQPQACPQNIMSCGSNKKQETTAPFH